MAGPALPTPGLLLRGLGCSPPPGTPARLGADHGNPGPRAVRAELLVQHGRPPPDPMVQVAVPTPGRVKAGIEAGAGRSPGLPGHHGAGELSPRATRRTAPRAERHQPIAVELPGAPA